MARHFAQTAATLIPPAFGMAGVNQFLKLRLTDAERRDLIEYLKLL